MADDEQKKRITAPESWTVYKQLPGLVLGFHGCDRSVAEDVLSQKQPHLLSSKNAHDWLGEGIYFWERDPWRALEWAISASERPKQTAGKIKDPYVIGAILDLGRCCNLLDFDCCAEVESAFQFISEVYKSAGQPLPENRQGEDKLLRFRDKIVIKAMHDIRDDQKLPPYQSVRAAFIEGQELYPGAGFKKKNHIQIAILDAQCIKGYFRLPGI